MTFAYIPEEELHRNVVEQDNLFLRCEVSRADAPTQWYKDGVEIQASNKVTTGTEHKKRTLIIQSIEKSDAGTYTCRAGGSALIFKINVRGKYCTFTMFDIQQKKASHYIILLLFTFYGTPVHLHIQAPGQCKIIIIQVQVSNRINKKGWSELLV